MLRNAGVRIACADVLEFGSRWLPVIPILFRLAGARCVTLTDQERLMDERLIDMAVGILRERKAAIALRLGMGEAEIEAGLAIFEGPGDIRGDMQRRLALCGLRYLVPFDPTHVPDGSIDIIVSRAVLEHVAEPVLRNFMVHFRRMLNCAGAMCHTVDMSDHWEHQDKSIGRINFLRYDDLIWSLTCLNVQNFQNRLRRRDYVQGIERAGFKIVDVIGDADPQALMDFDDMPIARRFLDLSREDAATLRCAIIGIPDARS